MSTTELPPGIYRISAARSEGLEPEYLTQEEWVTVAPPGAQDDPKQEWLVEIGKDSKDGNIVIGRVSKFFPSPFLSYQNNNEEAKPGDRVVVSLSDLPANEWSLVKASEYPHCYFIRVEGTELGIGVAPPLVHPPVLQLDLKEQLKWVFEFVRKA